MFGPLTPASFRMNGRDSADDAPQRFATEVQASGCMTSDKFEPMQIAQLQALAGARADESFSEYVASVCPPAKTASAH
jgi:hypothetical protein